MKDPALSVPSSKSGIQLHCRLCYESAVADRAFSSTGVPIGIFSVLKYTCQALVRAFEPLTFHAADPTPSG